MPLENADFIPELVDSNPTGNDDRRQGDDHIRMIKRVLLNTFPNVGAQVTLTDEQLNALASAILLGAVAAVQWLNLGTADPNADGVPHLTGDGGVFAVRTGSAGSYAVFSVGVDGRVTVANNIDAPGTVRGVMLTAGEYASQAAVERVISFAPNSGISGPYFFYSANAINVGLWWNEWAGGQMWKFDRAAGTLGLYAATRAHSFTATPSP